MRTRLLGLAIFSLGIGVTAGCGGPGPATDAGDDSGVTEDAGAVDAGPTTDAGGDAGTDQDAGSGIDAGPYTVSFSYTPAWTGVTAVSVIGGFGQSVDWSETSPFVTLTNSGGTWTGTAQLPAGTYSYLFVAVGDSDGPSGLKHLSLDPANSAFVACPAQSPAYSAQVANPCSVLTVPQPPAPPLFTVSGSVTYDGGPVPGYLAMIERNESGSHHFFVNRMDTLADGTFSLEVAPGTYRMQILHPTYFTESDATRKPLQLQALKRALSSNVAVVDAGSVLNPVEMSEHDYALMQPNDGGAPLPATFTFTVLPGATSAYASVFGGPDAGFKNIGDPWWNGANRTLASLDGGTIASDLFDGGFNTPKATYPSAVPGWPYFWGTWQQFPILDGGVRWTGQSMVFPVVFE